MVGTAHLTHDAHPGSEGTQATGPALTRLAVAATLHCLTGCYSLTVGPVLRAGVPFRRAVGVALAADTVSILVMEIVDNGFIPTAPGAIDAGLADLLFWTSLALSLLIAFVVTVPVTRLLIGRARGHAVVHAYHHPRCSARRDSTVGRHQALTSPGTGTWAAGASSGLVNLGRPAWVSQSRLPQACSRPRSGLGRASR